MPVYHRYPEDFTGANPDNFVDGELCSLSDRPIRVIVPKYGPFYVNSALVLYDNFTMRRLEKGVDYTTPVIVRELCLKTGMEVADAILIINRSVSSQVRLSYQNVGGDYQNNIDNIIQIYESFMNDNRSIDWVDGIYNKPSGFPPSPHPHYLSDVYGFEAVNVQLERLAQAIMLGNTPAFEAMLDAIDSRSASIPEMDLGLPSNKFVTLQGLLHTLDKYNFNALTIKPEGLEIGNGKQMFVDVYSTNLPDDVTLYWTIDHETTSPEDFVYQSGTIEMRHGVGRFSIRSAKDIMEEPTEFFRIMIRRNGPSGQVIGRTRRMKLLQHDAKASDSFFTAMSVCCLGNPKLIRNAKTVSVLRSRKNASYT